MHQMIAEVSKGAAALREACAAEPAYQTADDLWKGLRPNDLVAELVLTFAQRLRFNKRTRHSLQAAKRQEDKRWVRILRQEGGNLYLLMHQGAVPNRRKPRNTTGYLTPTERRTKVRLRQADAAAGTVDEQAAAALKATWSLVLSSLAPSQTQLSAGDVINVSKQDEQGSKFALTACRIADIEETPPAHFRDLQYPLWVINADLFFEYDSAGFVLKLLFDCDDAGEGRHFLWRG